MNYSSNRNEYRRRMARRRIRRFQYYFPIFLAGLFLICLLGCGIFIAADHIRTSTSNSKKSENEAELVLDGPDDQDLIEEYTSEESEEDRIAADIQRVLDDAALLAMGYDYEAAADLLYDSGYAGIDARVVQAADEYMATLESLTPYEITEITHVFFHSLIVDEDKAFDGGIHEAGYNQAMTTVNEFRKILDSLYERGYVLVRIHDLATVEYADDGSYTMKKGKIYLPEGKTPIVMSQDDVCYYEYMTGDGFATRMVIGDDGKPTCEYTLDDGSVVTGDYDLVPILEHFIDEHPDFSYRGARACIAFTGYEGILGYRTASTYSDSPTYEQDRKDAAAVAQCLKDNGWELASHSWGHLDLGTIDFDRFKTDCDKWQEEVATLIGPTDTILYPFGADISDWHPYDHDNERFNYLVAEGFRYFCNVDSNQYWVQLGTDYIRQGRRNLDGYRMWVDIEAGSDTSQRKLDDLFVAEDVFSDKRPTPVEWQ